MIGAKNADKEEIANETADVLYHLAVMLVETGVSPEDVEAVLKSRQGKQSNVHDRKGSNGLLRIISTDLRTKKKKSEVMLRAFC